MFGKFKVPSIRLSCVAIYILYKQSILFNSIVTTGIVAPTMSGCVWDPLIRYSYVLLNLVC